MAWMQRSIRDGACVGITRDENFDRDNVSEAMRKHFIIFHVDEPFESLLHLVEPVKDRDGNIIQKFRGKIDIDAVVPQRDRAGMRDKNAAMAPMRDDVGKDKFSVRPDSKIIVPIRGRL